MSLTNFRDWQVVGLHNCQSLLAGSAVAQVLQDRQMFTLPLGLKRSQASMSTQWGLYAAGALVVSLPVVVVFLLLSRYLVSGTTLGGVKE